MTKSEYIDRLRNKLKHMPPDQIDEIVYDYEEHFDVGLAKGKSEDEIAIHLGLPETVAAQYRMEHEMEESKQKGSFRMLRVLMTGISLGFFNLVFVLGIYLGLLGVLIALFVSAVGVLIGSGFSIVTAIVGPWFPFFRMAILDLSRPMGRLALGGGSLAMLGIGLLLLLAASAFGRAIFRWTYRYVRGNVEIIRKAGEMNE